MIFYIECIVPTTLQLQFLWNIFVVMLLVLDRQCWVILCRSCFFIPILLEGASFHELCVNVEVLKCSDPIRVAVQRQRKNRT